ncbi:hypothetical protein ACFWVC_20025 [Streptomyces sp. NPDC058691]|uniref:hypothetical protein n=1 Tax=Streptomyces sp. NPDC058691 TaxID=3346601 RepID=UPI00364A45B2
MQFELTGRADHGCGSDPATARADLGGTREALSEWSPLSRLSQAQREKVDAALDELVQRLTLVATVGEPRGMV